MLRCKRQAELMEDNLFVHLKRLSATFVLPLGLLLMINALHFNIAFASPKSSRLENARNWCRVLQKRDHKIFEKAKTISRKNLSLRKHSGLCKSYVERINRKNKNIFPFPSAAPAPLPENFVPIQSGCFSEEGEISCRNPVDNKIYLEPEGYCYCDQVCCLLGDCCINHDRSCPGYECQEYPTPTPTYTPTPYIIPIEDDEDEPPACVLSFGLETGATYNRPDCPSGGHYDRQELTIPDAPYREALEACYRKLLTAWKTCHGGKTPQDYVEDDPEAITKPFVAFFWADRPEQLDHLLYPPSQALVSDEPCTSCLERTPIEPAISNDLAVYWAQIQMAADGLLKVPLSDIMETKRVQQTWANYTTIEVSPQSSFELLWKAFMYNYTNASGERVLLPEEGDYVILKRIFRFYVSVSTHELERIIPNFWGVTTGLTRIIVNRQILRFNQHGSANHATLQRLADDLAKSVEFYINRDIGLDKPISPGDLVAFYLLYFYPEKFDLTWPVVYGVRTQDWYDRLPEMILDRAISETSPTFAKNHENAKIFERAEWEQLGMDNYFNNSLYVGKVLPTLFSAFTPMGVFGPKLTQWVPKFYGVVGKFYYEHPIIISFIPVIGSVSACIENYLNLTEGRDAEGNKIKNSYEIAAFAMNSAFLMLEFTALRPLPGKLGNFIQDIQITWKAEKGGLPFIKLVKNSSKMKKIIAAIGDSYSKNILDGAPKQRYQSMKALYGTDIPNTKAPHQMEKALLHNKRTELVEMYNNQNRWSEWLAEPWLVFAHFRFKHVPGIRIGSSLTTDAEEFVAWLRHNGYDGSPIALVGCNTGRNPEFAQAVADLTGAWVAGSRNTLLHYRDIPNIFDTGSFFIFRNITDGGNIPNQIAELFRPGLVNGKDYDLMGIGQKINVSNPVEILKSGIEDDVWKIFKPKNYNPLSRNQFATAAAAAMYPPIQLMRNHKHFEDQ